MVDFPDSPEPGEKRGRVNIYSHDLASNMTGGKGGMTGWPYPDMGNGLSTSS